MSAMKGHAVALLALSCMAVAGCAMLRPPADTDGDATVKAGSLGRTCSDLRADIDSARFRQRNIPPQTSAPDIAASAQAREDQRIETLQRRYDELGCALIAQPPPQQQSQ